MQELRDDRTMFTFHPFLQSVLASLILLIGMVTIWTLFYTSSELYTTVGTSAVLVVFTIAICLIIFVVGSYLCQHHIPLFLKSEVHSSLATIQLSFASVSKISMYAARWCTGDAFEQDSMMEGSTSKLWSFCWNW